MSEFLDDWNNHYIRKNKHTCRNVPCGRPADLYESFLVYIQCTIYYFYNVIGAVDCIVEADPRIWATAMMTLSTEPLPLCPPEFSENALLFLKWTVTP